MYKLSFEFTMIYNITKRGSKQPEYMAYMTIAMPMTQIYSVCIVFELNHFLTNLPRFAVARNESVIATFPKGTMCRKSVENNEKTKECEVLLLLMVSRL